jgi:Fe-S-cluster containining protein
VKGVADVVADFQREVVIPHCPQCVRPCCALTDVVLDLSFAEVRGLYQITSSRRDFDRALPSSIRTQNGRYYAHGAPCPAFHTTTHSCRVYGTRTKPRGCSDFPVYEDGDVVTVDLRCEAARSHLSVLRAELAHALGDVDERRDADFPDTFVTFGRRRCHPAGRGNPPVRSR